MNGLEEVVQPEFLAAVCGRLREQRPQGSFKTMCCGMEVAQNTLLLDSNDFSELKEPLPFAPLRNSLVDFQLPSELERLSEFIVAVEM